MCLAGGTAVFAIWIIVWESFFQNFFTVCSVSLPLSHNALAATHLICVERLAISFNCGLATILGAAVVRRLRGVHLHIHPTVRTRSLCAVAAVGSFVVGTLPLVQLLTGNRTPTRGEGIWVIDSCLLLTGFVFLFTDFRRLDLTSLTVTGGLCISASAELIVRSVRWSDTCLVVSIPCIFWACGLLQLGLWSDRFLPSVLCESIAARRKLRRLAPFVFVVPVVIAVLTGTLERWWFFDRGSDEAITASILCIGMAGVVVYSAVLLDQTEQGFWKLFEGADEAILMVELTTHHIRSGNTKAVKLFGHRAQQPGNCSLEDLFPSIPVEQLQELGRSHDGDTSREVIEVRWTDLSGRERWLELRGTLASFRGSDTLMVHARDVSELKNMERNRSQTEKMQALSQLAGGIAHEFNNLLQGMCLCSNQLAEEFAEGSEHRELLKHIDLSIESAQQLTQWLFAYCGQRKSSYQRTNLNRLLTSVAGLLRRTLGSAVSVQTKLCEQLGEVRVDPVQMEEILINLALNARDAMPDGGTLSFETQTVTLSSADRHAHIPPGRYLLLSVIDTGVGMNEETASRAFEPFFTTKQRTCGTGLGLSVVYGIVTQSAGFIRLESGIGKGTKVKIFLPVYDENGRPGMASNAAAAA